MLQAAIEGGAPSEEALAVLERLNRVERPGVAAAAPASISVPRRRAPLDARRSAAGLRRVAVAGLLAIVVVGAGGFGAWSRRIDWRLLDATLRGTLPRNRRWRVLPCR